MKLTQDGVVKLLDFGLAKATSGRGDREGKDTGPGNELQTHDGLILGTGPT